MLLLNDRGLQKYDETLKEINIDNIDSIYDALESFRDVFVTSNLSRSLEYEMDTILEWVESTIIDTFDYRNSSFEDDLISLSETMCDLPDSILFDPIFELLSVSQEYVGQNNKLFCKHERKGISISSIDDIFNALGFLGCIEQSSVERCKASLEVELATLTEQLNQELSEMALGTRIESNIPFKESAVSSDSSPNRYKLIDEIYDNIMDDTLEPSVLYSVMVHDLLYITDVNSLRSGNDEQVELLIGPIATYLNYLSNVIGEAYLHMDTQTFAKYCMQIINYISKYRCKTSIMIMKAVYILLYRDIEDKNDPILVNISKAINNGGQCQLINAFRLYSDYLSDSDTFRKNVLTYKDQAFEDDVVDYQWRLTFDNSISNQSRYIGENAVSIFESMGLSSNKSDHFMNALAEKFSVRRDGTIKITLDERTTFMNEYSVNHRLIKLNYKQGDIDGMKYNLAVNMFLIDTIEREVLYNKRISKNSRKYRDAEKARRFAMNDISTYLPIIMEHDPTFDLNQFYKDVKAEENTVEINGTDTVVGLKKIFNSILLS